MKPQFNKYILFAPLIALAAAPPAMAADQSFASATAVDIASDASGDNSVEYLLHFQLAGASDGLSPATETTLLSNDPDPSNPFVGQMPRFQVVIPPGCWVDNTGAGIIYQMSSLGCGAQVQLFDPVTASTVSLNGAVTSFSAELVNRSRGFFKATVTFDGSFDAGANTNPAGVMSFSVGNDGVAGLSLNGRLATRGTK